MCVNSATFRKSPNFVVAPDLPMNLVVVVVAALSTENESTFMVPRSLRDSPQAPELSRPPNLARAFRLSATQISP